MRDRESSGEAGYILFGIVILIVILGVFLVAAVPLWQKAIQREREQELIFRGYQYMQAIERYQRKFPGAYPPTIEVLVEQKFLRKAYKDPFAGEKGEWNVFGSSRRSFSCPGSCSSSSCASRRGSPIRTAAARSFESRETRRPAERPVLPGRRKRDGTEFQSSLGRGASDASMGGIVGVASRSTEKTFYKVPGKEKYKDWLFVWGVQQGGAPLMTTPSDTGSERSRRAPFPGCLRRRGLRA